MHRFFLAVPVLLATTLPGRPAAAAVPGVPGTKTVDANTLSAPLAAPQSAPATPLPGAATLPGAPALPSESDDSQTLARAINLPAQQKMPESFGAPNQLVLGGSTSLNLQGTHLQLGGQKANSFALGFEPWVGGFVARHFLVGGIMPISYVKGDKIWYANVGVGPIVGWHIPVGTHFALLPRVAAAYLYGRSQNNDVVGGDARLESHSIEVNARLDAIVHLTHHLSVAVGPYATMSVYNRVGGAKAPYGVFYGIKAGLLGWL